MNIKCSCGNWIHPSDSKKGATKCAACLEMTDPILRKHAEEIADLYQSWGNRTYIVYSILKKLRKEIEQEES
jgi:hypothetical protein